MFSSLFLRFSPLNQFLIRENSMEPYVKEGERVLTLRYMFSKPKVGEVIIFHHSTPPHVFIKRISRIEKNKVWVVGDNKKESVDSRTFGFINRENIIGKVITVI